jgi:hypothetical protein
LEDADKDKWEMKVKKYIQKAVDTEEWESVITKGQGSQRAVQPRRKSNK